MHAFFRDDEAVEAMLAREEIPLPEPTELYRQWFLLEIRCTRETQARLKALTVKRGHRLQWTENSPLQVSDLYEERESVGKFYGDILGVARGLLRQGLLKEELLPAPGEDGSRLLEFLSRWFRDGQQGSPERAERPGLMSDIVLRTSLRPFFVARARHLGGNLKPGNASRSRCPVCGSRPDFALLDRERGGRWLICGFCDTNWPYLRIGCPYCDNRDHHSLIHFTNATGTHRLYTCGPCRSYLKARDLRKGPAPVSPAVERILTLPMDEQAVDAGYVFRG